MKTAKRGKIQNNVQSFLELLVLHVLFADREGDAEEEYGGVLTHDWRIGSERFFCMYGDL
jgi:hypothetical protein